MIVSGSPWPRKQQAIARSFLSESIEPHHFAAGAGHLSVGLDHLDEILDELVERGLPR